MTEIDPGLACHLSPVTAAQCAQLSDALPRIDPWRRLGTPSDAIRRLIERESPDKDVDAISAHGRLAGLVVIRKGWLFGDYLNILAILPEAQGTGLGKRVIDLVCDRCRGRGGKNLWACVSAFNAPAIGFYEKLGFQTIGQLDDLVIAGEHEILIRKRLD